MAFFPNRSSSRIINQRAIVEKIYQSGGISRAQIAKELGISKPAVTSNVEKLIETGLIEERGEGLAGKSGGRKPIMLYFNASHRYIGALDLSLRRPVCAVADLQYRLIGIKRVDVSEDAAADERRQEIKSTFERIFSENSLPLERLCVIVISQPGVVEEEGKEHYSGERHHLWTEIGLSDYLGNAFRAKTSIVNDVNAAALGEINFGCTRRTENLIYVSCGRGIGAGIVIGRRLYTGPRNAAGEIGSFIMPGGGTLEDSAAAAGLVKRAEALFAEAGREARPGGLSFGDIVLLSREGNPLIERAIYETGRELGAALFNTSAILDIDTIILGGDYMQLGDKLFDGIEDVLAGSTIFRPEVLATALSGMAGVYGCFVIGAEKIISYFTDR